MGSNTDSVRIEIGPELYRLGNPASSNLELFDVAFAGAVFDNGSAIIVDVKAKQVIAVDSQGESALLGRRGSGPGELEFPVAVFASIGGKVGILDAALSRLTRFTLTGNAATRVDEYRTAQQPARACSTGDGYVVLSYSPTLRGVFSRYALDGTVLGRFGPPFAAGSPLRVSLHTSGPVICHGPDPSVIAATQAGELLSYGLDGRFKWRMPIPGAEPGEEFGSNGAIGFRMIPKGATRSRWVLSLVTLPGGIGAVQLQEYVLPGNGSDREAVRSRVLTKFFELESGRLVGEQDDVPHILHSSNVHILLRHQEVDDDEWVSVSVFRLVRP